MHEVLNDLIEYQEVLEKANKIIHGRFRGISGGGGIISQVPVKAIMAVIKYLTGSVLG